ncbi:MAG: mobile mystery protein A [Thermodesulfobacteriota bacterium]
MKPQQRHLVRKQLEKTLTGLSSLQRTPRPTGGWLRAIREALGMSGRQFAHRLRVSPSRVTNLEQSERSGGVTLKSLQQAAHALDCVFVYAVVPRKSLSATIHKRAESLAQHRLQRVAHTMLLEEQQLSPDEQRQAFEAEVERLMLEMPKELWEELDGV